MNGLYKFQTAIQSLPRVQVILSKSSGENAVRRMRNNVCGVGYQYNSDREQIPSKQEGEDNVTVVIETCLINDWNIAKEFPCQV